MKIASISENKKLEKRVAITPEIAKKYLSLGFEVSLSEKYGHHLGINDKEFTDLGVKIFSDEKEVLNSSDIIVQLGLFSEEKMGLLKKNKIIFFRITSKNNKSTIYGCSFFTGKFSWI